MDPTASLSAGQKLNVNGSGEISIPDGCNRIDLESQRFHRMHRVGDAAMARASALGLGATQYQPLISCDAIEMPEFGHFPHRPLPCLKLGQDSFHLYDDWI